MKTVAVLPMKSFGAAKQRLTETLAPGPRRALAEAMFSDVLVALRRATSVDQVLVVTSDHAAEQIGAGYGALTLEEPENGHNDAAARGARRALEDGAERVLMVPGDCPLLDPIELGELLVRRVATPSVLIVPDRHGTGTNALLLTPPDCLMPSFGPGSCQRHLEAARAAGVAGEVVGVPSLALDVDTGDDLDTVESTLFSSHGGAAHTRGMLAQLRRSRALTADR
jgi:2-phospho-L-lactate/phosphoenolpyruvate guanylyltransferase